MQGEAGQRAEKRGGVNPLSMADGVQVSSTNDLFDTGPCQDLARMTRDP